MPTYKNEDVEIKYINNMCKIPFLGLEKHFIELKDRELKDRKFKEFGMVDYIPGRIGKIVGGFKNIKLQVFLKN